MYILQLFHDNAAEWFEINEAGKTIAQHSLSDLSQCPKINPDAHLIVLYPGEKIIITAVKLPKMRAAERAQAIPFALEERLASDPDAIVTVIGDTQPDGTVIVAVMEKIIFEAQLTALHDLNIYPRVILPDFLALIWETDTWSVLLKNQMAIVRTGYQQGFSADANNLFLLLKLMLEKNKNYLPKKIVCWQEDAVLDTVQFEKLGVPIEMRADIHNHYFDFKNISTKPAMNFLQGKYRPKTQSSAIRKNWIICALTFAALMAFLFLSDIAQWFYFRHQSIALEKQVLQTYQVLFPSAKTVLEPRFRTKTLLKRFDAASRGSVFFQLLSVAGKTMLSFPDIQLQGIDFQNKQLTLTVNAKNVEVLSQWSDAMHAKGLSLSQRVLSTDKNSVQATMTAREDA